MLRLIALLAALLSLSACASYTRPPVDKLAFAAPPPMRWDHRPEAEEWTRATLAALQGHGAVLAQMEPADIETWCPGYRSASQADREAFWVGLFSALAKHESTWNPRAVGGGGLWYGLVQIDPRTARGYKCRAQSGSALKDGAANLSCAVRIAAVQVPKRGTVDRGMRDWGPFHSAKKRAEMSAWTRGQSYCQPKPEPETPRLLSLLAR